MHLYTAVFITSITISAWHQAIDHDGDRINKWFSIVIGHLLSLLFLLVSVQVTSCPHFYCLSNRQSRLGLVFVVVLVCLCFLFIQTNLHLVLCVRFGQLAFSVCLSLCLPLFLFVSLCLSICEYIHGVSIKTKPNCVCHIYLNPNIGNLNIYA